MIDTRPNIALRLRRAEQRDMRVVFELSNDPVVRANSIHSEPISWGTHVEWYKQAIHDKNLKFLIVETYIGEFVGVLRLHKRSEGWIVTIHINNLFRGQKAGQWVLSEVLKRTRIRRFIALVKPDNIPSNRLFIQSGYQYAGEKSSVVGGKRLVLNNYIFFR